MLDILKEQCRLIQSVKEALFSFLEEIPLQKLHETVPDFGIGNIIEAHIHAADCYRYWLGSFAFKQKPSDFTEPTKYDIEHSDVKKVRERFELVDEIVQQFLDEFNDRWFENIENEVDWRDKPLSLPPLFLLTHAETHEFHHKGQIVSMVRHLGFNPPADDRLGALFS